jgi:hypothetical protein
MLVVPLLFAETLPVASTEATEILLLLHVAPPELLSAEVEPAHADAVPVMGAGNE